MTRHVLTDLVSSDRDWFCENCSNEDVLPTFSYSYFNKSEISHIINISDTDSPITPLASDLPKQTGLCQDITCKLLNGGVIS